MTTEINMLLKLGGVLLLGWILGQGLKRAKLPVLIGYLMVGVGLRATHVFTPSPDSPLLQYFCGLALLLLGLIIGAQLRREDIAPQQKTALWVGITESVTTFFAVALGLMALFAALTRWPSPLFPYTFQDGLWMALLLGAVAISTSPVTPLAVMNEFKRVHLFSKILLASISINNLIAVLLFGMLLPVAGEYFQGHGELSLLSTVVFPLLQLVGALALGAGAGFGLAKILAHFQDQRENLVLLLGFLVLLSGLLVTLGVNPLLAGMALGIAINVFKLQEHPIMKSLHAVEAPLLAIFFIVVGNLIQVETFLATGIFGLIYFSVRVVGKAYGAGVGTQMAGTEAVVKKYLGISLIPQAATALAMVLMLNTDPHLAPWNSFMTTVILIGVLLSEIIGPYLVKLAITKVEETKVKTVLFGQEN